MKLYDKSALDIPTRVDVEFALEYDNEDDIAFYVADEKKLARKCRLKAYYQNIQLLLLFVCLICAGILLTMLYTQPMSNATKVTGIFLTIGFCLVAYIAVGEKVTKNINAKLRELEHEDLTSDEFYEFKAAVDAAYHPDYWPDFFDLEDISDKNAIYRLSEYIKDGDRKALITASKEGRIKDAQALLEPYMQNVLEDVLSEYPF